jgi:tRNA A37 methylthiotransferase MiaB
MFEGTLALVEDCGLTWLHVFPFSPRKGTPRRGRTEGFAEVELAQDGPAGGIVAGLVRGAS